MSTLVKTVAALRQKMQQFPHETEVVSTGVAALDRLLPAGEIRAGSLVEYLGTGVSLARAATHAVCQDRALIVLDRQRQFYPADWGNLPRVVILRPANEADEIWALDQSLRCPGVGAVVVRCEHLDSRDFRRLQIAAEQGRTVGLLIRPTKFRGQPSWADVQWLIEPDPSQCRWRVRVQLVRCRGGTGDGRLTLEFDEQTNTWQEADNANPLPLPASVADSTTARRRTGA